MRVKSLRLALMTTLLACRCAWATAKTPADALQLTLPPICYATVGVPLGIYYDNIVLTETPEKYLFQIQCKLGQAESRRWVLTPQPGDVGDHPLAITVANPAGRRLATARCTLHVAAADAGAGKSARLLIVGDSLTHASTYPNEIARLLARPGNPTWQMLGTHRPAGAAKGVAHEGYGGWTWDRFLTHYEPNPDGTYKKRSSPFVFAAAGGQPAIDFGRYFQESCGGQPPDFVTFLLGINDCFAAQGDPAKVDARIAAMLTSADALLTALHRAAPQARVGICLTTPPNARESGFEANYKGKYHRWGWKQIQHRLVQRQIEHFGGQEARGIHLVPTELNLDPLDGYPANNGVHPNAAGYQQIGASIYAWLKSQL